MTLWELALLLMNLFDGMELDVRSSPAIWQFRINSRKLANALHLLEAREGKLNVKGDESPLSFRLNQHHPLVAVLHDLICYRMNLYSGTLIITASLVNAVVFIPVLILGCLQM